MVVAVLGVGLGLFGRYWQHARRQAAGRAEVTRLGGEYRWDWDEATGYSVDERNQWIAATTTESPDRIRLAERLFGADFSHDIVAAYFSTRPSGLSAHPPTDGDVQRLVGLLPELKALDLSFTPITDEALKHLVELPRLEWLNLYATPVSDAGLPYLNRLPKLRVLIVAETEMTVPGVARAAALRPLSKSGSRLQPSAPRRNRRTGRPNADGHDRRDISKAGPGILPPRGGGARQCPTCGLTAATVKPI